MLKKYIKNNIHCCILPTMNVEKVYEEQHSLLYSYNDECEKVYKEQHSLLYSSNNKC